VQPYAEQTGILHCLMHLFCIVSKMLPHVRNFCALEKSFSFDKMVEITSHSTYFPIHV